LFLHQATTEAKRQYPTVALIDGGVHAVFIALNVLAKCFKDELKPRLASEAERNHPLLRGTPDRRC